MAFLLFIHKGMNEIILYCSSNPECVCGYILHAQRGGEGGGGDK